jgi:AraC-like DNA-binding protein
MKLNYAPPPGDLADCISAFYLFEADIDELNDIERADVGQVRIVLDGSATLTFADGREEAFLPLSILGPRLGASTIRAKGPHLKLFGLGLLASGWARAIKKPAHDCVNRVLSPVGLLDFDADAFCKVIAGAANLDEMVALTVALFRKHYAEPDNRSLQFITEVDQWLLSGLNPPIADLEAATGLSRRQVERRTKEYFGAPPKFLVRKYRALRAANAIANDHENWREFVELAYYDQSHFIREIKEFTGMTPGAIRNSKSPLSALVFGRVQLAGFVTPLVSKT